MKKSLPLVLLLGCAAALVLGLAQLFDLKFAVGDVYPPYSTLRSDPLGTMAFYESLEKLLGVTVRRDYNPSGRMPGTPATTYLVLAARSDDWDWMSDDQFQDVRRFVRDGGRLVMTLFPQTESFGLDERGDGTNSVPAAGPKANGRKMTRPDPGQKDDESDAESGVWLGGRWGFHLAFRKLESDGEVFQPVRAVNRSGLPLPRTLKWHSGVVLTRLDPAWRTIYGRGAAAVVIERRFGSGSVVLATDSYFVSNEAMAGDRRRPAEFLAWLIGPNRRVVFDETHLGIVETSGVATLMRQYRLHGLVAGLLVLAGLFIWKNSTSLAPARAGAEKSDPVLGRDAASGFVNLLRRCVAPGDLLTACFQEWKKSAPLIGGRAASRRRQAEAVFQAEQSRPARERDAVRAYRAVASALTARAADPPTEHPAPKP